MLLSQPIRNNQPQPIKNRTKSARANFPALRAVHCIVYVLCDWLLGKTQYKASRSSLFFISAKSQLREVLDDLAERSKVKLNYELPDSVVEDYTYEMGRLKFKVTELLCAQNVTYVSCEEPKISDKGITTLKYFRYF